MTVSFETTYRPASLTPALQESDALQRRLEAASAAMDAALSSMETKEGIMRLLETGSKYLGLVVSLGKNAVEVRALSLLSFTFPDHL